MSTHSDVIVVGAGLVGMFAATELANQGIQVGLIDYRSPSELLEGLTAEVLLFREHYQGTLEGMHVKSREILLDFIEKQTGGMRTESFAELQLIVAPANVEAAKRDAGRWHRQGVPVEYLSASEIKNLDSGVSPEVMGALLYHDITGVDSEALYRALFKVCESDQRILKYWRVKVLGLNVKNGRTVGLRSSIGPLQAGQVLLASGIGTMGVFTSTGVQMPPVPEKTYRLVGQLIDKGPDRIVTEYILPGSFAYRSDAKEDSGFYVRISACIRKGQQTSVGEAREFVLVNNNGSSDQAATDAITRHFAVRMPGYENLIFDNLISRFNCFIPDGLPIVGPAPNVEALFFALYQRDCRSMIGPALGNLAAQTMIAQKTLEGMEDLSPERFPQSAPGGRKKSFGE